MIHLVLFILLSFGCAEEQAVGTPISFVWQDLVNLVNRERQFYNLPVIDYDDDVAKIAQQTCEKCAWTDVRPAAERQQLLVDLKGLVLGDPAVARYQTVGENRAASAGVGADPSPALWLNRADWKCADNTCTPPATCGEYTQAIWATTLYMGCGKCLCTEGSPEPQAGPNWSFLVCNFVEAGNFGGGHPFGVAPDKDKLCARTFTPVPPPQPAACSARTCTNLTACPSPTSTAVCNTTSGQWVAPGPIAANELADAYLGCGLTINGDFSATGNDKIKVSDCGSISVTGATTFSGNPTVDIEFNSVSGLGPDYYQKFFVSASAPTGGFWGTPIAQDVWSPSILLCARSITGSGASYVYLYDCGIAAPVIADPLPDGAGILPGGTSPFSEAIRPPIANSGGDMNDPDLQTQPKKNIDGTPAPGSPPLVPGAPTPGSTPANGSSGPSIPGWAIFLIVLACILIIIIIIVLVFLLATSGGKSERF